MKIAFERALRTEARGISPQRLAAARRAIEKDRENNALTPELVKPYNVDPETRIEHADARYCLVADALRTHYAKCWREGRRMLMDMTPEMRRDCLDLWNREMYPLTGTYFVEHCRRCLKRPHEIREVLEFLNRRRIPSTESEALVKRDRMPAAEEDEDGDDEERDQKAYD